jgi:hypothetical protein
MQKRPLPLKAMIAALAAAIPTIPLSASVVPSPKVPPSVFATSAANAKGATAYSKSNFLLKDAARIGPAGAAIASSDTKATKKKSTKQVICAKVQTAANGVRKLS